MQNNIDVLASNVRSLILEFENLESIIDDISDSYIDDEDEIDNYDHPVSKLITSHHTTKMAMLETVKILVSTNLLDPHFKRSLQKLATMDALVGNSAFVKFVRKHAT